MSESVDIYTMKEHLENIGMIKSVPRTCFSCRWSIGSIVGLRCKLKNCAAESVCEKYQREPGADEPSEV